MDLDKFIRDEEKIRKLLARRQKGRYLSKARISRVIRKLNYRQDTNVIYQLEKNDPGFLKLARRNQELLTTNSLELKVYRSTASPFASYTRLLEGNIHENGILYLAIASSNIILINFEKYKYPMSYYGYFNYLGEMKLKAYKVGFAHPLGLVPTKFKGSVDETGNVFVENTDAYREVSGLNFTQKIISDPCKKETTRKEFIQNRDQLKKQIHTERQRIIHSFKQY